MFKDNSEFRFPNSELKWREALRLGKKYKGKGKN